MDDPKWQEVLDIAIKPAGDELLEQYPDLKWGDDPNHSWQALLKTAYDNNRGAMRSRMNRPASGQIVIDRHKIGAALAKAILETRPLRPKHRSKVSEGAYFANESLALDAAISIIVSFGLDDAEGSDSYCGDNLALIFQEPFCFPIAHEGPYRKHMHMALKHASRIMHSDEKIPFDEFMFANLLFLLEWNHIQNISQKPHN